MHRTTIAANLNVENMNFAEDAKRQVIDEKMALIKAGDQEWNTGADLRKYGANMQN